MATLSREAVLREAGRTEEAEALRIEREKQGGLSEDEKAEAEKSIQETVENIRHEREKMTGQRLCK
jgi:hypothetical protein